MARWTAAEEKAWAVVAEAARQVLLLPEQHPMEREEVAHAFHQVQNYLLARAQVRLLGFGMPDTEGDAP